MRVSEEKIAYWAKLIGRKIKGSDYTKIKNGELEHNIKNIITKNFQLEDEIEKEARKIMQTYAEQIKREMLDYNSFFLKVKRQLMKEKGVVI